MSRGLGRNQRAVVKAMEALRGEYGPGWVTPAEVITEVQMPSENRRAPTAWETIELIRAKDAARRGDQDAARRVAALEERGVTTSFKAKTAKVIAQTTKPKTRRPRPRAGEGLNPARIFAALKERGLIERDARFGPGSRVRLVDERG